MNVCQPSFKLLSMHNYLYCKCKVQIIDDSSEGELYRMEADMAKSGIRTGIGITRFFCVSPHTDFGLPWKKIQIM